MFVRRSSQLLQVKAGVRRPRNPLDTLRGLLAAGLLIGAVAPVCGGAQLALGWTDNSDNEAGFRIERALGSGAFAQIATVAANTTAYTDEGLEPDSVYRYRVAAFNAYGDSDYSNIASATTPPPILQSNTAPTIAALEDRVVQQGTSTGAIGLTIGDAETPAADLTLRATSSNTGLVPALGLQLGGSGANRTLTITPSAGQTGTTLITVTVSDGALEGSVSFTLQVQVDAAPLAITSAPVGVTTYAGGEATLSVVATGSDLTYQWYLGASGDTSRPVSGATASHYTTPALSTGASYWVRVSSGAQSIDSGTMEVAVSPFDRHFFGSFGGGGGFGIVVRADGSALMFADAPGTGIDICGAAFTVASNGTFAFSSPGLGEVSGQISGGGVSGFVSGAGISFSGDLDDLAGSSGPRSGLYQGVVVNTSDGPTVLVGTNGRAFVLTGGSGAVVSVASDGTIATSLADGRAFALSIGAGSPALVGALEVRGELCPVTGWRVSEFGATPLVNASVRAQMRSGEAGMIAGFIIAGTGTKRVLLRGVGPTLAGFGVTDAAQDPTLVLYRQGDPVSAGPFAQNDNWSDNADAELIAATTAEIGAFALPWGSGDAAMVLDLAAGAYTAHVVGSSAGAGTAIVEVYGVDGTGGDGSTARLANISMRNEVGSGSEVLIAGFIVEGDRPKRLLIRAVGPELATWGVAGALANPVLNLHHRVDGEEILVASNDNWSADATSVAAVTTQCGAFSLTPDSGSAAISIWLQPGAYTAVVSSGDGGRGVVLTEVYEAP